MQEKVKHRGLIGGWDNQFIEARASWLHDRNPLRPYARLTSEKISNGFFNGGRFAEHDPEGYGIACRELWRRAQESTKAFGVTRIIGAAMGAITLACRIGEAARIPWAYAEKVGDGFAFTRAELQPDERFLIVEDTITTGGTLEKLKAAALTACPRAEFSTIVLALCNRSGKPRAANLEIISLITPAIMAWDEGENPFTSDGKELVEPVRPKTHWHELTRDYP